MVGFLALTAHHYMQYVSTLLMLRIFLVCFPFSELVIMVYQWAHRMVQKVLFGVLGHSSKTQFIHVRVNWKPFNDRMRRFFLYNFIAIGFFNKICFLTFVEGIWHFSIIQYMTNQMSVWWGRLYAIKVMNLLNDLWNEAATQNKTTAMQQKNWKIVWLWIWWYLYNKW